MNSTLKILPCSFEAAKHAVMNYHYSRRMPSGKLFKLGVWENDVFIGAVIFGRGANNHLAKSFGLLQTEAVELVRVALKSHIAPVSKIVAISLKLLKQYNPGLKMCISYADLTNQGHMGTIYQASNWIYLGERKTIKGSYYKINGQIMHGRSVRAKWGSDKNIPYEWEYADQMTKHLYIFCFDKALNEQYRKLHQPYPKKVI